MIEQIFNRVGQLSPSVDTDAAIFVIHIGKRRNHFYTSGFEPVPEMFFNSAYIALMTAVGQVFFCSLAGYAFAKLEFKGREILFKIYLSAMMDNLLMAGAVISVLPVLIVFLFAQRQLIEGIALSGVMG